ncbi:MAG: uroporphyrinogen-III C-methyltransferase [Hyphomicrobiales bacterium]|nr:uroporphyrinogen-III C-methyltransferase [Hyphomicrobiales bacterium]
MKPLGKVSLVGAGPGDPDLLTVKALKALQLAEVIVYDRLVSDEILALAPTGAARINVGKQAGQHPVSQVEINELLVRLAKSGRTVVRLKGGDPFIFGRGSEEALELKRNHVDFEVVPGITSAQGCAASLCLPLTHRGLAKGVRFVTGHCRDNLDLDLDWSGLSDPQTTLVIYMGLANINEISERLLAAGRSSGTPAMAVNNATHASERHLLSTLGRIAEDSAAAKFIGPVLFIIGEVVGLHDELLCEKEQGDVACLAAVSF